MAPGLNALIPSSLFGFSSFTIYVILIFIAIALIFWGKASWKIIMYAMGAYIGFVFTSIMLIRFHVTTLPTFIILLIGAVVGAILVNFAAKAFICFVLAGSITLALYLFTPINTVVAAVIGIIIFFICYVRFEKLSLYVAAFAGAMAMWFALVGLGVQNLSAQVVAGVAMIGGIMLQKYEEDLEKRNKKIPPFMRW